MREHISKIKHLIESFDDDTLTSLENTSRTQTFLKGSYLLEANSIGNKSYWIKSGILRKFYQYQDREITTEFYFEDELALSFDSYILNKQSREYIQALTTTVVSVTDYTKFHNIKARNQKLQELDFLLTEYYALWLEEKVFELHTQNATCRYETLLKKSPHIVKQVQLTQIASYLNISLETLSRIRAKI